MLRNEDNSLETVTRLNQPDQWSNSPLINAVYHAGLHPSREATARVLALVNNPAVDISFRNRDGNTALDVAKIFGKIIIREAIEHRMQRESSALMAGEIFYSLFTSVRFFRPAASEIPSANFDERTSNNLDF